MANKRLIVGSFDYGIPDEDLAEVVSRVKEALEQGTIAELTLVDNTGRRITAFLNGRSTQMVVLDLDLGPKPSEISGG